MDTVTNAMYAKVQWEEFRYRIVRKEHVSSLMIHEYFNSVDEMNRTRKELNQWTTN